MKKTIMMLVMGTTFLLASQGLQAQQKTLREQAAKNKVEKLIPILHLSESQVNTLYSVFAAYDANITEKKDEVDTKLKEAVLNRLKVALSREQYKKYLTYMEKVKKE